MSGRNAPIDQQIVFVTGKGGVGKSLVAAALAWSRAEKGQKVLLLEFGANHFFQKFFLNPKRLPDGLTLGNWEGEECLKEYILGYVRVERVARLFFENKVMKALIRGAPALRELALLGKLTSGLRNIGEALPYDTIVLDGYATGHFLSLLRAPVGIWPHGRTMSGYHECVKKPSNMLL